MKHLVFLSVFLLFNCTFSNSQSNNKLPDIATEKSQADSTLNCVEVSFCIDESGAVQVLKIDSEDPELVQFILERFERVQVDPANYTIGKVIRYRFKFKVPKEELARSHSEEKPSQLIATFAEDERSKKGHSKS